MNIIQIATMRETLLSLSNPQIIISENGKRFLSAMQVKPDGKITKGTMPVGTLCYTDYHQWKSAAKGTGDRAKKAITLKGNLIYIILP